MTNQDAARILDEQRNKFMDEWVDFGGVNEAYNMAISLLKDDDACERRDEKTVDRDSTIDGLQHVADMIHEYTDKPWIHTIEVDCELILNALALLKEQDEAIDKLLFHIGRQAAMLSDK